MWGESSLPSVYSGFIAAGLSHITAWYDRITFVWTAWDWERQRLSWGKIYWLRLLPKYPLYLIISYFWTFWTCGIISFFKQNQRVLNIKYMLLAACMPPSTGNLFLMNGPIEICCYGCHTIGEVHTKRSMPLAQLYCFVYLFIYFNISMSLISVL